MNQYRVSAITLNVRNGPSRDATILGFVRGNEVVEELERSADRLWIKIMTDAGEGWVFTKWLEPIPTEEDGLTSWMTLANQEIGVAESPGSLTTPRINEYFRAAIHSEPEEGDELPWCSAFANWVMETSGFEGTHHLAARSWETWGDRLADPRAGAVAVFSRSDPANPRAGHVAFLVEPPRNGEVQVLGGNQGNRVCKSSYPIDGVKDGTRYKLLSLRWPGGIE